MTACDLWRSICILNTQSSWLIFYYWPVNRVLLLSLIIDKKDYDNLLFFVSSTNVSHEANEKWDVQNWLNKENRGQQMWTEMEIMKIIIFSWMKYRNLSSTLDPKDEIRDHQTNNYSTDLENSFIISQFGHLYWIKHYNVITILDLWTDEIETQKKTWFQWTRTEMSMVLFRSFCIFFENHLHFGCQIHGWRQQMTMTW